MAGLARIAKMYGGMTINGKRWVWDYDADKAVPESEMPMGSERHKRSEMKRYGIWPETPTQQEPPHAG